MLVVFRSKGQRRWMEVKLVNGCLPCLSSHFCNLSEIDMAVWFKVLVLETICVDCDRREVSWTYTVQASMKRRGGTIDSLQPFASRTIDAFEIGCTKCCDSEEEVDEMFAAARQLTDKYDSQDDDHRQEHVLQLLNSYLLPAVSFQVQDAPFIKMAIEDHLQSLKQIDQNIEDISTVYKESKEQLSHAISNIVPECKELLKSNTLSKDLLKSLYDDIDKECQRAKSDVAARAAVVHEQKLCKPADDILISSMREDRNSAHQHLEALMTAREHVYQALHSCQNAVKETHGEQGHVPSKLIAYMVAQRQKHVVFTRQQGKFEEKVAAAIVRESLIETLKQLQTGQQTHGVSQDVFGEYATDVVARRGRKQTQWQDIKGWMADQLKVSDSHIGDTHRNFCEKMKSELSDVVSMLRVSCQQGAENYKSLTSSVTGIDIDDYDDSDVQLEPYRDSIKPITKQVLAHIQMMSELICHELGEQYEAELWKKRVWIAYERYCYDNLGSHIEKMYQFHYMCDQTFLEKLKKLSEKNPAELDLGMPAAPWLIIFNRDRIQQEDDVKYDASPALLPSQSLLNFSFIEESVRKTEKLPIAATVGSTPVLHYVNQLMSQFQGTRVVTEIPTFTECFGCVTDHLSSVLCETTPFNKLQCLTAALRKVTSSIARLKSLNREGNEIADVGGDDLLPSLVLILTRLDPSLVSSIRCQTHMLEDLMPDFLTRGCHAFALAEFQVAFQVIESLL